MTRLINQLMNDEAVYRTAPATPGLLNIGLKGTIQKTFTKYYKYWYVAGTSVLLHDFCKIRYNKIIIASSLVRER